MLLFAICQKVLVKTQECREGLNVTCEVDSADGKSSHHNTKPGDIIAHMKIEKM